jgi:hypothetical protein
MERKSRPSRPSAVVPYPSCGCWLAGGTDEHRASIKKRFNLEHITIPCPCQGQEVDIFLFGEFYEFF